MEAIQTLPRVIGTDTIKITKPAPKVVVFNVEEVKQLLVKASNKTKLYILMAINCGMTGKDISDLAVDEVDWEAGRITRRRSKTKDEPSVPAVSYKLWGETLRLLQQERAAEGDRVLVSASGGPLLADRIEDGKHKKVDCIKNGFFRLTKKTKIAKPFGSLKKTSGSLIRDSEFTALEQLFLGQASTCIPTSYGRRRQDPMKPVEWLPSGMFVRLDHPKTHKGAPAAHCCLADGPVDQRNWLGHPAHRQDPGVFVGICLF